MDKKSLAATRLFKQLDLQFFGGKLSSTWGLEVVDEIPEQPSGGVGYADAKRKTIRLVRTIDGDLLERLLEIALAKAESAGGAHWRLATSLNNLAEVYRHQGRSEKAMPLYQRAIEIDERLLEKDSRKRSIPLGKSGISLSQGDPASDLASDLNNLALVYDSQGRFLEAIFFFTRAIRVCEGPLVLRNYAETLRHVGQRARAAELDSSSPGASALPVRRGGESLRRAVAMRLECPRYFRFGLTTQANAPF